jgi:hypothetical protein
MGGSRASASPARMPVEWWMQRGSVDAVHGDLLGILPLRTRLRNRPATVSLVNREAAVSHLTDTPAVGLPTASRQRIGSALTLPSRSRPVVNLDPAATMEAAHCGVDAWPRGPDLMCEFFLALFSAPRAGRCRPPEPLPPGTDDACAVNMADDPWPGIPGRGEPSPHRAHTACIQAARGQGVLKRQGSRRPQEPYRRSAGTAGSRHRLRGEIRSWR